jgi:tetratricopeptide (TPR) repeat protein
LKNNSIAATLNNLGLLECNLGNL